MYLAQDQRRLQLLEVGLNLFSTRPYDEVSIDEIAAAAEVSRGLMYHYFRGKRGFYTEVVRLAANRVLSSIAPDLDLEPSANLDRGIRAYFDFVSQHDEAYLALMRGGVGSDEVVAGILDETRGHVVDQILEGMEVDRNHALLRLAIGSWIGQTESAAMMWLVDRPVPLGEVVDVLRASFAGILLATVERRVLVKLIDRATLESLFRWSVG